MPTPVKQLGGAVTDTVEISWQFEANLSDLPPEGVILDAPGPVPLPGSWKLELKNDSDDPDILCLSFQYGSLPVGTFGKSVVVKARFARGVGIRPRLLVEEVWSRGVRPVRAPDKSGSFTFYGLLSSRSELAENSRWPISAQNSVQEYCCTITIVRDLQPDTAPNYGTPTADVERAHRLASKLFHHKLLL